jgi:hypothetical protein
MCSHQPSAISHDTERLWRARKDHSWIDACVAREPAGVALLIRLEGEPIFTERFATRALAVEDAARRLRDLQRVGWTTHW